MMPKQYNVYKADAGKVKMVTTGGRVLFRDLQNNRQYQALVQKAQETEQDLCATLRKLEPLEISEITLCEKKDLFVPKVFIKNNNRLWGTLSDIKVVGPFPSTDTRQTIGFLNPQEIRELQTIITQGVYTLRMQAPSGKHSQFIANKLWVAKNDRKDVVCMVTTDWRGNLHIVPTFETGETTDKLMAYRRNPSLLMRMQKRIIDYFARRATSQ